MAGKQEDMGEEERRIRMQGRDQGGKRQGSRLGRQAVQADGWSHSQLLLHATGFVQARQVGRVDARGGGKRPGRTLGRHDGQTGGGWVVRAVRQQRPVATGLGLAARRAVKMRGGVGDGAHRRS